VSVALDLDAVPADFVGRPVDSQSNWHHTPLAARSATGSLRIFVTRSSQVMLGPSAPWNEGLLAADYKLPPVAALLPAEEEGGKVEVMVVCIQPFRGLPH
jgi:hypothetical protein